MAKLQIILGIGLGAAIAISLGVVIGWFSRGDGAPESQPVSPTGTPGSHTGTGDARLWQKELHDEINAENIRENLRNMTREPHLAGTEENRLLAQHLTDQWNAMGFDAHMVKYDVLLAYPGNVTNRNRAIIKYQNNTTFTTALEEKILDADQNNSKVVPPFNAFSKGGPPVTSNRLYYVNYARAEDFEYLSRNKSVNFTGSLVIARYGRIFRGNKLALAQKYGAAGVILYSDPKDYAFGVNSTYESTFPNSWWLPPSGVQRGTTYMGNGDPLTPGYPAKDGVYRMSVEEVRDKEEIPNIPSHPIGYDDATHFLRLLTGDNVAEEWKGSLNVDYKYGGVLSSATIELQVNNYEQITSIYNAIGVIRGQVEPDRYVLLGNHRDAWIFGSLDPSSGTASLLEVSRAFSKIYQKGWRPRRTLVFCSWGAEEYGLIGSNEWVEEYAKNLLERAVAYINVDIAVEYNYKLEAHGSPLLHQVLYNAASNVTDPESERFKNVYESWQTKTASKVGDNKPKIGLLGSGSDHASFYQKVGIPSIDMSYTFDDNQWPISGYPLYHSVYETFLLAEKYTDPKFLWHQAMGRLWAEVARQLVDTPLLPFSALDFATALDGSLAGFKQLYTPTLQKYNMMDAVDLWQKAISNFRIQVQMFEKTQMGSQSLSTDPYSLRRINDQLMQLERAFTDPAGLPGYPERKHLLYSQSSLDTYSGSAFPGVADALYGIDYKTGKDLDLAVEETRKQMARVLFVIESATATLRDVEKLF